MNQIAVGPVGNAHGLLFGKHSLFVGVHPLVRNGGIVGPHPLVRNAES